MLESVGSRPVGEACEKFRIKAINEAQPESIAEYERYAKNTLPRNAHDYYASGSNDMITLRENREAFARLRIVPRVLGDVSSIQMETTILGTKVASPILIAPTAMQQMAHPDGELATARAAHRLGTLLCLSSLSTKSIEAVGSAAGSAPKWFQLYLFKDRSLVLELLRRVKREGYTAVVLTVDTPRLGRREPDVKNHFSLPPNMTLGHFAEGSVQPQQQQRDENGTFSDKSLQSGSALVSYFASLIDDSLSWSDVQWLRARTSLPLVVKGVMSYEDAALARKAGVDAIWVSNHGGRQLDTAPATIEVLADVLRGANGLEVYLDGGITRGSDVLKALALGARAVFVGRAVLWGLARGGEEGVSRALTLLNEELRLAMQFAGVPSVHEAGKVHLVSHDSRSRL